MDVTATVALSVLSTARQTSPVEVAAAIVLDALPRLRHGFPQRSGLLFEVLASGLISAFAVRLAMAVAMLIHEWAHLVLASAVHIIRPSTSRLRLRDIWSLRNCLGQTPLLTWLRVLRPFSALPAPFDPHITLTTAQAQPESCSGGAEGTRPPVGHGSVCLAQGPLDVNLASWQESIIRLGAWALSTTLFLWTWLLTERMKANQPRFPSDVMLEPSGSTSFSTFIQSLGDPTWDLHPLQCACLGSLLAAVGSTATDLLGFHHLPHMGDPDSKRRFFCGNFGMLVIGAVEDARKTAMAAMEVLQQMTNVSSERGGQSGGLVTLLHSGTSVSGLRVRVMPGKRQNLAQKLLGSFRLRVLAHFLWLALIAGPLALFRALTGRKAQSREAGANDTEAAGSALTGDGVPSQQLVQLFAGHTRFATSSIPSVGETHPHQWCPRMPVRIWRMDPTAGGPRLETRHSDIFVTHNGDFEFFNLFDRDRTHSEMGPWLEVVLGVRQPAHCDSVMVAGLMDLLRTQGMWAAALRLAYHQAVIVSYEEVFSETAVVPQWRYWEILGRAADAVFQAFLDKRQELPGPGRGASLRLVVAEPGSGRELEEALVDSLRSNETRDALRKGCRGDRDGGWGLPDLLPDLSLRALEVMVAQAIVNFFENDVFGALKQFLTRAKGSFGMCVCSALDSDRLVLAALNQAVSVGFAPRAGAVLYSSESFSLTVPLPKYFQDKTRAFDAAATPPPSPQQAQGPGSKAWPPDEVLRADWRLDLDEGDGEVLEIVLGAGKEAAEPDLSVTLASLSRGPRVPRPSPWESRANSVAQTSPWESRANSVGQGAPANGAPEDAQAPAPDSVPEVHGAGMALGALQEQAEEGTAASGRHPVAIPLQENPPAASGRLRLRELPGIALRLFCVRSKAMVSESKLREERRLVPISGNPCITLKQPKTAPGDLVALDLRDVPRVLEEIREEWQDAHSLSRLAAEDLVGMLKAKAANADRHKGVGSQRAIDVLITGVENSLWVGEQFAADLQNCFPELRVVPMSANKVIGVMGNARGAISASGFSFARMVSKLSPSEAIVIAISQSGQTFPALHATRILARHCPGRVFVCVGMLDSKMATAVGQSLDPAAPPSCRVFHTHAGWRSAEPASVAVAAAHATLTEVLLHAARALREDADRKLRALAPGAPGGGPQGPKEGTQDGQHGEQGQGEGQRGGVPEEKAQEQQKAEQGQEQPKGEKAQGQQKAELSRKAVLERPLGLRLSLRDIGDLERMRDAAVLQSVPDITGWDAQGHPKPSQINQDLKSQGWQWALHITETPLAFVLSGAYIFGTVISGWPIFTAIRKACGSPDHSAGAYIALTLDSAVYLFLPLYMALLLRLLQGRDLLARIGKRTLVIADIPYVNQVLEEFVSKMFALSFWIASLDVHGANPMDHFVHRFTHRVTRGTLIAVGRPDGRLCSQTKCESWVLMALLQARTIVNLWGTGPEVITVGHNPFSNAATIRRHLALPSNRPQFLCEKLLGVDDEDPQKRLASREHAVAAGSDKNLFHSLDTEVVGLHLCDEGTVEKARQRGLAMISHGMCAAPVEEDDPDDPSCRGLVLAGLQLDVKEVLQSQVTLEAFTENRFLSLQRLLAFQVMFHRMAQLVASLPLISFDISRSQSRLRIATTAAPISAADLEREWMDSLADVSQYPGFRSSGSHHGEGSIRHRLRANSSLHRLSEALHALFEHRHLGHSHHGRGTAMHSHHGRATPLHSHQGRATPMHSHHGGTSFHWRSSPSPSLHSTAGGEGLNKASPLPPRPGSSQGPRPGSSQGKHPEESKGGQDSLV